jgi:hypothetical protein
MRPIFHVLIAFAVPFIPLSIMGILGIKIAVQDFTTGACLRVKNSTAQALVITPIGTRGGDQKTPLPTIMSSSLGIPSTEWGGYNLEAGEEIEICFDYRYTVFSDIIAEDPGMRRVRMIVDPNPAETLSHAPELSRFTIEELTAAGPIGDDMLAAYNRAQETPPGLILMGFIFGPWLIIGLGVLGLQCSDALTEEQREEEVKRYKVEMMRPWGE